MSSTAQHTQQLVFQLGALPYHSLKRRVCLRASSYCFRKGGLYGAEYFEVCCRSAFDCCDRFGAARPAALCTSRYAEAYERVDTQPQSWAICRTRTLIRRTRIAMFSDRSLHAERSAFEPYANRRGLFHFSRSEHAAACVNARSSLLPVCAVLLAARTRASRWRALRDWTSFGALATDADLLELFSDEAEPPPPPLVRHSCHSSVV